MINVAITQWIGLPIEIRVIVIAILGLVGAAAANHVIYTYAYFNPRPISPWLRQKHGGNPLTVIQRIPIIGWLLRRGESEVHGRGFWVRPLLIEMIVPAALVALYYHETQWGGLLPPEAVAAKPALLGAVETAMHQMFLAHLILLCLMVAATFIDFDERTIPDIITVPGTILGLTLAAFMPEMFPPTALPGFPVSPTTFDSPQFTPSNTWWQSSGLMVGLGIWTLWCFALADRRISGVILRRRGLGRMIKHFIDGLFHYPRWKALAAMWGGGLVLLPIAFGAGGIHWYGCFSSLVGLAAGAGIVWAIRIIGSVALRVEAMGFGDVTLMAMIGSYIGWQGSLLAFFLAPFAAIIIVIARYVLTRDPQSPFGPYLCAGTALAVVYWNAIYNHSFANYLLAMGSFLLWLGIAMLGLMFVMLWGWRLFKERFIYQDE